MDTEHPEGNINRLLQIMNTLRTPVTGCPWDLEQTFQTVAPYTIEEAYEVADAIERDNMDDLVDELGDLLLQVVFHSQMAREADLFTFGDVVDAISTKMIRRHPHVFGDKEAKSTGAVKGMWEDIKRQEISEKQLSNGQAARQERLLDSVPFTLPALMRAVKLQKKAAQVGFDWPTIRPVFDKIREEIDELEAAILEMKDAQENSEHVKEEIGDLFFAIANLARHLRLEPEAALQSANAKFLRRFNYIEDTISADGRDLSDCDLSEMDMLWDQAKLSEK